MSWPAAIAEDLRLALRRLAGAPGFAALAIGTLALGLGSHVAVFSLIETLFLRPLPVADPQRLVGVYETRDGAGYLPLSLPDYADYRDRTTVFSALAAHYPGAPLSLGSGAEQEEINGSVVSANYFSVLGVKPALGRFFLADEDAAAAEATPVAVLSHRAWKSRFAGRADAVGATLTLNGTPFTVVGVAPEGFDGVRLDRPSAVWIPTAMAGVGYRWCDATRRDCTWLNLIGRLAPGRTVEGARAETTALAGAQRQAHPRADGIVRGVALEPLAGVHPAARAGAERLVGLLLAIVTLVVAVAATNLGGLLVARGVARRREIATRMAIGASRARVVALFVAEAVVLALAGGAGGLVVAGWLAGLLARFYPSDVPIELGVDGSVLGYAAVLALATGLAVGAVAGIQASRPSLVAELKASRRPRLLGALAVAQVALSFVLVTSTGLLLKSLGGVGRVGGLDPAEVAVLRLRPRLVGYGPAEGQAFNREVLRRLEALPGVRSASLSAGVPPFPFFNPVEVGLPGPLREPAAGGRPALSAWSDAIAPDLFETLGIPIVGGRDFDRRDVAGSPPVAIVNETLAATLWPDRPAVGRLLVVGGRTREVVGVARDAAYRNATEGPAGYVYTPYWQDPAAVDARVSVRAAGAADRLLPALRREVQAVDPRVPVTEVETMRGRLARRFAPVHLAGRALGASAGLALLLTAVGLYGVLALGVAQRTRDIGVRMALGGTRLHVVSLVVRETLTLSAVAVGVGLVAAFAVTRALAHYLYGVGPHDPSTFAGAAVLLALVAALAAWRPARRASRVDPLVALRHL